MGTNTDGTTIDIEAKLAEAELYTKHGLKENAYNVYEELLNHLLDQDHPLRSKIEERLNSLRPDPNGIQQAQKPQETGDSPLSKKECVERFENCNGLIEAGFYEEALTQLDSLLEFGYRLGSIRAKIGECCLRLNRPFEALEHLEAALDGQELNTEERLNVLDRLAMTYENIGSAPSAIKALEQMVQLDASFRNASIRLKKLSKTAQKFGRFYFLIKENLLSEEKLERARESARQKKKTIDDVLMDEFGIIKAQLGHALSEHYGCPFVEYDELELGTAPDLIQGVKEQFFRRNMFIPMITLDDQLLVITDNPHDMVKLDNIRSVCKGTEFHIGVSLGDDINKFIDHFFGKYAVDEDQGDVFEQLELIEVDEYEEDDDEPSTTADGVVVQMANKIIEDGVKQGASDIHIEGLPGKRGTSIRFRIDGECIHYKNIPFSYKRALVSRIKIISKLDISERRLPQDGKIKFINKNKQTIELRVATIPTVGGNEDIVLRILASGNAAIPLDKMGLQDHIFEKFTTLLRTPYGLLLVCGPTGSGKTTTLHAALNFINTPEKKIWTVEDPVEIMQDGLRQVQVEQKIDLDFARVLRSFLRADPDVIMVGETRDEETARTVIVASLTGHLVFSTLHTNSAPETVTRLLGMGMDPLNFADALLGVLAQRLVRRLCSACKEAYEADDNEKELIKISYGEHPVYPLPIDLEAPLKLYRAKGCSKCGDSGYKGRLAIHELLVSNDVLKRLVEKSSSVADIRKESMRNGMQTLLQDGIIKVLAGHTDFQHVRAACVR